MSILDCVGQTPLLELKSLSKPQAKVYAKAEFMNPSGSVKDRAAKAMIVDGIKSGLLTKGKTILDATSGNTGIALAMIGASLGYPIKLYLPANASFERKAALKAYGAEVIETDPLEGSDGALLAARQEFKSRPTRYFYPDQYSNEANPKAHYESTGVEIWEQTGGKVTHFVAIMGTSGTFTGTTKRLKDYNPKLKAIAVQPDSPFHGIEGTKHMASTIKPAFYDEALADDTIEVGTEEAYALARHLASKEGLFVGISAAANALAASRLAGALREEALIVTVLCDSGMRYAGEAFWSKT